MKSFSVVLIAGAMSLAAVAKLPAPSDEAKAKAAEAAAKTAHNGKVDAFLLCKYQDKTAASYYKAAKSAGKETKPAPSLPACADPGPFVYTPAAAAPAAPATAVASASPAPAAGKDSKKP
jgi:hypothetical protein